MQWLHPYETSTTHKATGQKTLSGTEAGGREQCGQTGTVSFWGGEHVLELDGGDGHTTL